jgi:uncharacterized protein YegP (UPF0339 family)
VTHIQHTQLQYTHTHNCKRAIGEIDSNGVQASEQSR